MFRLIFVFLLIPSILFADERFIGNVMSDGAEKHYTVVVEKEPYIFYILEIDGDEQKIIVTIENILLGKYEGTKMLRGDERTPEGVYYVTSYQSEAQMIRWWGKEVAARYGTGAFPISYPNPIDKILKKTGDGIWIHGLEPERHKPVTEGCVGLQNEDLNSIKQYLPIGTPVVIIDNALFMNADEYKEQRQKHLDGLNTFIQAWNHGDYDVFASYVHPKYSSYAGRTAKDYLARKKTLMERFPQKTINISNVNVYRQNDHTLVYDFDQLYCAENLVSFGNKRIYLMNEDGKNKVVSEEIFTKPLDAPIRAAFIQFLNDWQTAWESKDIDKYMEFYAPNFKGRNEWKDQKANTFANAGDINVKISDVKWNGSGGNRFTLRFRQDYSSDVFSNSGIKTLRLVGCPGSFKIESETWSRD
jgi:murein L,D-transpeptidase YafK